MSRPNRSLTEEQKHLINVSPPHYMTTEEAGYYLGFDASTIRTWVRRYKLSFPFRRLGSKGEIRIPRIELDQWYEKRSKLVGGVL